MTAAKTLISELKGTQPPPLVIVDDQTTSDIIRQILKKHSQCAGDYDRIAPYFQRDSLYETCEALYDFCRSNFNYVVEDEEAQYTSAPITMLTNGAVDCKNYSLFCGGVLDALRREGLRFTWCYRFASYDILRPSPGHVFVVVNPNTDNIWVDPVIDTFDQHEWYWYHKDRKPKASAVGAIGRLLPRSKMAGPEDDLLKQVYEYWQGLVGAIKLTTTTGQLNAISQLVLQSASLAVPGIGEALAAIKAGSVVLNNTFGPGSIEARLFQDIQSPTFLITLNIINDIFNGRTYNTDQYWAAVYYQFYVLGQNVTDINSVKDSDVYPALKWFIDRTGVFISGREHIIGLTQSPGAYTKYASVNGDTTTDMSLVTPASRVAQTYWHSPGNFDQSLRGSWSGTVGVFDTGLAQLAASEGLTPEQFIRQSGQSQAVVETAFQQAATPSIPSGVLWLGAAAIVLIIIVNQ